MKRNKMKIRHVLASALAAAVLTFTSTGIATAESSSTYPSSPDSESAVFLGNSCPEIDAFGGGDAVEYFADIQASKVTLPSDTVDQLINTAREYSSDRSGIGEADWANAQAAEYEGIQLVTVQLIVDPDIEIGNQLSFVFDDGEVVQVTETNLEQTGNDQYHFQMWQAGNMMIDESFSLETSMIEPLGFIKRVFLQCMDSKSSALTSALANKVYKVCAGVCATGPVPCATCFSFGAGIDLSSVLACAKKAWK
ncbi:MAG: hypothetical protein ACTH1Z_10225 [Ancrocorticia sp.]|uniref:hypothetical protein n=1 Tax=Ancrocorticia sp. TaxID=2593684 RepID=UPI003F920FB5